MQRITIPLAAGIGLAAAAAMALGAFGPWIKVIGLINLSVSGTDGSNDGWLVVAAAAIAVLGFVLYVKQHELVGSLLAIGGGLVGFGVTLYDRGRVSDGIAEMKEESALAVAQIGWGLNLAMGASVVLGVAAIIAFAHAVHRREGQQAGGASERVAAGVAGHV